MGIWLKCINRNNKKRSFHSLFAKSDYFTYSFSRIYLGAEGKAVTIDGRFEFLMSSSVTDGILVMFRQNLPYKILFDYVDGAYYVNDNQMSDYNGLVQALLSLQNQQYNGMSTYYELEKTVFDFISDNMNRLKPS